MKKLEVKHLAPYLPYGLQIDEVANFEGIREMVCDGNSSATVNIDAVVRMQYKPILRPFSDLTKEIDINGERFVPLTYLSLESDYEPIDEFIGHMYDFQDSPNEISIDCCPKRVLEKLFEWHFDVFDLIEKGLAININDIES